MAAVFIVWMLRSHGGQRLFGWALSLILGGAVGNVIDRLLHGYVVDFIQVHYAGCVLPVVQRRRQRDHDRRRLLILDELLRVRRTRAESRINGGRIAP